MYRDQFQIHDGQFDRLAGGSKIRMRLKEGKDADEILAEGRDGINTFRRVREKYLLYK